MALNDILDDIQYILNQNILDQNKNHNENVKLNYHSDILLERLFYRVTLPLFIAYFIFVACGISALTSLFLNKLDYALIFGLVCCTLIILLCTPPPNLAEEKAVDLKRAIVDITYEISDELILERILSELPYEDFKNSIHKADELSAKECCNYANMAKGNQTITFFPIKNLLESEKKQKQRKSIENELIKVANKSLSAPEDTGKLVVAIPVSECKYF